MRRKPSPRRPATNSFDSIINLYRQNAAKWEATLANYALTLFWILVAIDLTLTGIRLAVKGAEFGEWASELVSQILFIGFFFALLKNAPVWASAIVNSFRTAASQAVVASGGTSLIAPSDVFSVGLALASKLYESASWYQPHQSFVMFLFGLVLIVCFAIIAALLIVALVESYIVISAGVLFMGFGGSKLTKDFAVKILVYAVSVGAKLFIMQLLIGLGQQVFNSLAANFETNSVDVLVVIGSAIVMLALTWFLPQLIQGMINGTAMGGNPAASGGSIKTSAAPPAAPSTPAIRPGNSPASKSRTLKPKAAPRPTAPSERWPICYRSPSKRSAAGLADASASARSLGRWAKR